MFDPKDPTEAVTLTFDYSATGQVSANPAVSVRLLKGIDANPSAMLDGSPQILDSNKVLQRIIGGVNGCVYEFRCFADIGSDRPLLKGQLTVEVGCCDAG